MTQLPSPALENNQIVDIAALSNMGNLSNLSLSSNPVTQIEVLTGLARLTERSLSYTDVDTIAPIAFNPGFGEGAVLYIYSNEYYPMCSPDNLHNIESLVARGVKVFSNCG